MTKIATHHARRDTRCVAILCGRLPNCWSARFRMTDTILIFRQRRVTGRNRVHHTSRLRFGVATGVPFRFRYSPRSGRSATRRATGGRGVESRKHGRSFE